MPCIRLSSRGRLHSLLLCLLLFLCLPGAVRAATVTVGVYENPPLVFRDDQGRIQGLAVDVLRHIALREGWQLRFVEAAWPVCLEKLAAGEIDLQVGIAVSNEREKIFDFNKQTLITNWGRVYSNPTRKFDSLLDLDGASIGVLKDDIHAVVFADLIQKFGFKVNQVSFSSYDAVLSQVEQGTVDAGVVNRLYGMRNGRRFQLTKTPMIFNPIEVRYAAPKGKGSTLLAAIDHHLHLLKEEKTSIYYQSLEKWFGESDTSHLPNWIKTSLLAGLFLFVLLTLFLVLLRLQVRRKTIDLEREISVRKSAVEESLKTEKQFRSLIEQARDAIFLIDLEGRIIDANQQACTSLGYGFPELLELSLRDISPVFQKENLEKYRNKLCSGTPSIIVESLHIRKDGTTFPVEINVGLLEIGEQTLFLALARDVTERKQVESKLRESEFRFRELFNNISSGVAVLKAVDNGRDFMLTEINTAGRNISRLPNGKVHGKSIREVLPGVVVAGLFDVLQRVYSTGTPEQHPVSQYLDNRVERWIESYVYKLPSDEVVAVFDDATAWKKAADELKKSEAHYASLFTNNHSVMLLLDPLTGDIMDANPAACTYYGYSKAELLAMKIMDISLLDGEDIKQRMSGAMAGKEKSFLCQHRLRNGEVRDVEVFSGPLVIDDRTLLCSVYLDVTERRQMEREVARSQELWEKTFNSFTDVVTLQDTSMRILKANQAACSIMGLSYEEIIGRPCYELFHGSKTPCPACPLLENDFAFEPYSKEVYHERLNKLFLLSATAVQNEQGKMQYIAHVAKDISDRKNMEEQLVMAEKMSTIAGLAAGVAHEINTPLSAILQSIQVIQRALVSDLEGNRKVAAKHGIELEKVNGYVHEKEIDFFMEGIRESANNAARIVANLLQFSRPHEGTSQLSDLRELLDNSLQLARADYDLKKKYDIINVAINREYDPDLPSVSCVPMEIEQVILNLLKNAVQAMADTAAERKPNITVRASARENRIRFEIEDNGPGMEEEVRRHAFDPFFTTKDIGIGTGLGLSVSYGIICDKHKGWIRVESQPGKGTNFIVELPLTPTC